MTTRAAIPQDDTIRLWVRAGGRCEYHGCNEYLLEDSLTTYICNFAERAHIVGATNAPKSPRGKDPLPLAQRNLVENLMLLCTQHHHLIDQIIEEHGVDGLRTMKRNHEARIRLLTGLQANAETVVVRAVGGIRNAPTEISTESVRAAVIADDRYPRYRLAFSGEDLEIDLRGFTLETPEDWAAADRSIAHRLAPLSGPQGAAHHVSVFALTRIPLLVALGYHLDDKIPVTVYPRRRDGTGDQGWGFSDTPDGVEFATTQVAGPTGSSNVALAVSVAAPIADDVIAVAGSSATVYNLASVDAAHGRDLLGSRAALDQFADAYHRFLADVERDHPACTSIDLYAAVPAAGAVQIGRGLMRDSQPALRIYDRGTDGSFDYALTVG